MTRVILSDSGTSKGDIAEDLRDTEEIEWKKDDSGAGDLRFGVSVRRRGPSSSSDDEDGDVVEMSKAAKVPKELLETKLRLRCESERGTVQSLILINILSLPSSSHSTPPLQVIHDICPILPHIFPTSQSTLDQILEIPDS